MSPRIERLASPLLLALALPLLLSACGGEAPPGVPVSSVFGVVVPQGSVQVAEEEVVGNEGASSSARYLVSPKSVEELDASLAQAALRADPAHHRYDFEGGVRVRLTRIADIPRTLLAPTRPVVTEAPSRMRSWIVVLREGRPDPCPPCPEGFTGTIAPGCNCRP